MPHYSRDSRAELATCHEDLQRLFMEVIKHFDCTIIQGHRGKEEQNTYYRTGKSTVKWPNSNHNKNPSDAVDVAPYPIDWTDTARFYLFAGVVLGIASQMGINIRWGGDWDRDTDVKDNNFNDLVHFERGK